VGGQSRPAANNKVTRDDLNALVDRAADLIRTAVDYKFILTLLFMKRLNDQWKVEKEQYKQRLIKEAKLTEKEAEAEAEKTDVYHSFKIPRDFLWDEATKDVADLPQRLATAIGETAKLNKELQGVINRIDFLEFARNQENRELLRQLVELFNKYDLAGEGVSPDILGDAYEHIIMKFAPLKAKEGEIYTPREVIKLLVEILDPQPTQSVYDPCCGSGGMLIGSHTHVEKKFGIAQTRKLFLFGQERNPEIYAVCQMNLILHDIKSAEIANADSLDYPKFRDGDSLRKFDIVIGNPPWNQDGYGEERLKKADFRERFSLGYPKRSNADWAWIQHMLASGGDKGRVGIVIDTGALFRGGVEKIIRGKIIEKDWVECVLLTPEKLFYNTIASGAIIVFNKEKPTSRKDKIVFINATNEYVRHPSVKRLNSLSTDNISKVAQACKNFSELKGFSTIAKLTEVKANDYNLSISLYVMPNEKQEFIDIGKEFKELKNLESQKKAITERLDTYISEITKVLD